MTVPLKAERRLFGRRELAIHAWVQIGRERRACMIRNLSENGAFIEFDGAAPQANTMRLFVDFEDFEVQCDVRHRQASAVGVFFRRPSLEMASSRQGPTGAELARQIRELWKQAENG